MFVAGVENEGVRSRAADGPRKITEKAISLVPADTDTSTRPVCPYRGVMVIVFVPLPPLTSTFAWGTIANPFVTVAVMDWFGLTVTVPLKSAP